MSYIKIIQIRFFSDPLRKVRNYMTTGSMCDKPVIKFDSVFLSCIVFSIDCCVTAAALQTNPVSGKACSSTKGGLICLYMQPLLAPQTTEFVICISIYIRAPHRHITSPSEKSRPETWPGNYMGKATLVWQLTLSYRCHQM